MVRGGEGGPLPALFRGGLGGPGARGRALGRLRRAKPTRAPLAAPRRLPRWGLAWKGKIVLIQVPVSRRLTKKNGCYRSPARRLPAPSPPAPASPQRPPPPMPP